MTESQHSLRSIAWLFQFGLISAVLSCAGGCLKVAACFSMPEAAILFMWFSPLVLIWTMWTIILSLICGTFIAISELQPRWRVIILALIIVGAMLLLASTPCGQSCCLPPILSATANVPSPHAAGVLASHDAFLVTGYLLLACGFSRTLQVCRRGNGPRQKCARREH